MTKVKVILCTSAKPKKMGTQFRNCSGASNESGDTDIRPEENGK